MTVVREPSASTQVLRQEHPFRLWSSEEQQGALRLTRPTRHHGEKSTTEQTTWYSPIEISGPTDRCLRGLGPWIADNRTPVTSGEPEPDPTWGFIHYALDTAGTISPSPSAAVLIKSLQTTPLGFSESSSPTIVSPKFFTSVAYHLPTVGQLQTTKLLDRFRLRAKRFRQIIDMEEMLREFSELPDNWDSYGGRAVSLDAIEEAKSILRAAINLDLPEPWVAAGGDAGIGIQWDTNGLELYIDVVPGEETTYVLTRKEENFCEADGVLTVENLSRVLTQLA